ncbi:MAG: hypothetical protein WDW36_002813 [Sanguina aurantia]
MAYAQKRRRATVVGRARARRQADRPVGGKQSARSGVPCERHVPEGQGQSDADNSDSSSPWEPGVGFDGGSGGGGGWRGVRVEGTMLHAIHSHSEGGAGDGSCSDTGGRGRGRHLGLAVTQTGDTGAISDNGISGQVAARARTVTPAAFGGSDDDGGSTAEGSLAPGKNTLPWQRSRNPAPAWPRPTSASCDSTPDPAASPAYLRRSLGSANAQHSPPGNCNTGTMQRASQSTYEGPARPHAMHRAADVSHDPTFALRTLFAPSPSSTAHTSPSYATESARSSRTSGQQQSGQDQLLQGNTPRSFHSAAEVAAALQQLGAPCCSGDSAAPPAGTSSATGRTRVNRGDGVDVGSCNSDSSVGSREVQVRLSPGQPRAGSAAPSQSLRSTYREQHRGSSLAAKPPTPLTPGSSSRQVHSPSIGNTQASRSRVSSSSSVASKIVDKLRLLGAGPVSPVKGRCQQGPDMSQASTHRMDEVQCQGPSTAAELKRMYLALKHGSR